METVITSGNIHDSVTFDEVYDKVTEAFSEVESIVADSAYRTPHICKKVFDDGRVLSTAYKRPQTMKWGYEWWNMFITNSMTVLFALNTSLWNTVPQARRITASIRAIQESAQTVPPEHFARMPGIA